MQFKEKIEAPTLADYAEWDAKNTLQLATGAKQDNFFSLLDKADIFRCQKGNWTNLAVSAKQFKRLTKFARRKNVQVFFIHKSLNRDPVLNIVAQSPTGMILAY